MKKIITAIFGLACVALVSPAHAVVDNTLCTVTHSGDDSSVGSLRRDLDQGYNRTQNRSCTEVITFGPGEFNITPGSTFTIGAVDGSGNALNTDVEFVDANHPTDGANLTIKKGQATSVTIDATGDSFSASDCVLAIKNPNVKITGVTIKSKTRAKAVCGTLNADSNVTIVAKDDQCSPNSTCCDANGRFASAGTACENNTGTCGGSNATCTPNPVHECTPNSECCDGEGNWVDAGTACNDNDAGTDPDACNAEHHCVGTPVVVPECVAGTDECCDGTGHWVADGGACTEGGQAGTCDATHSCNVPTTPVCGNSAVETGEQCDDGNTTAGDGCDASCQTETPASTCGNGTVEGTEVCDGVCCEADCSAFKGEGTACDDGNASTSSDQCNAAHACVGTANPGGGTVTPGGGQTPGGGSTTPDNNNTDPINLGGGGSSGCMIGNSAASMAPLWVMILGLAPMMIRRKK